MVHTFRYSDQSSWNKKQFKPSSRTQHISTGSCNPSAMSELWDPVTTAATASLISKIKSVVRETGSFLFSLPQYRFGEARLEEMHPDRTQREEDGRPNEEAIERRVGMGTKSVTERRMKKKKKVKHKRGWKTEKINEERKKNWVRGERRDGESFFGFFSGERKVPLKRRDKILEKKRSNCITLFLSPSDVPPSLHPSHSFHPPESPSFLPLRCCCQSHFLPPSLCPPLTLYVSLCVSAFHSLFFHVSLSPDILYFYVKHRYSIRSKIHSQHPNPYEQL